MRDQHRVIPPNHLIDQRQCTGDVRVLVLADKIADMCKRNDLLDLAQGMAEG